MLCQKIKVSMYVCVFLLCVCVFLKACMKEAQLLQQDQFYNCSYIFSLFNFCFLMSLAKIEYSGLLGEMVVQKLPSIQSVKEKVRNKTTDSFALQKLCNFIRSHLQILDLTAQAIAVLFRNFFPCTHIFEGFPYFLLNKFQCLWFYVEFLNPLRFDLSTRRQEWINLHSST